MSAVFYPLFYPPALRGCDYCYCISQFSGKVCIRPNDDMTKKGHKEFWLDKI